MKNREREIKREEGIRRDGKRETDREGEGEGEGEQRVKRKKEEGMDE